MNLYVATTQALKYDYMVISETEEKAWLQLRKWWNDTWKLPKEERWKVRSATFVGIAKAMADQWG